MLLSGTRLQQELQTKCFVHFMVLPTVAVNSESTSSLCIHPPLDFGASYLWCESPPKVLLTPLRGSLFHLLYKFLFLTVTLLIWNEVGGKQANVFQYHVWGCWGKLDFQPILNSWIFWFQKAQIMWYFYNFTFFYRIIAHHGLFTLCSKCLC